MTGSFHSNFCQWMFMFSLAQWPCQTNVGDVTTNVSMSILFTPVSYHIDPAYVISTLWMYAGRLLSDLVNILCKKSVQSTQKTKQHPAHVRKCKLFSEQDTSQSEHQIRVSSFTSNIRQQYLVSVLLELIIFYNRSKWVFKFTVRSLPLSIQSSLT